MRLRSNVHIRLSAGISLAVLVFLAVVYFWSHGGQATDVRLEVRDQGVLTFVDGRPRLNGTFASAESGGLVLVLEPTDRMPALPPPNGVDHIVIRDTNGGILFEDDFSEGPEAASWQVLAGKVRVGDGVWQADGVTTRLSLSRELRDYTVDLRIRNMTGIEVGVRTTSPASGVFLGLRPFRLHDTSLGLRAEGRSESIQTSDQVQLKEAETVRAIGAMALRPLPLILGALLAAVILLVISAPATRVVGRVAAAAARARYAWPALRWQGDAGLACAAVLAAAATVAAAHLLLGPAEGVPHVPDELSYIFQGKVLASGHFAADPPPAEPMFQWSNPAPILVHEGRWASMYPPVHPLMLAIGLFFGVMWLVPPMIGGASVLLLYLLGRHIHGAGPALLATALFALSPFFLMTASNFMSHNTTAFFLLAALYCLVRGQGRSLWTMALTGFLVGAVFGARPLTGLAIIPPIGLFLILSLAGGQRRLAGLREGAAVAAGGVLALLLYVGYQYMITGDPLHVEGTQGGSDAFGFGGAHSIAVGLTNEQTQLAHLLLVMHNWTPLLGLGLTFLPFVLGSRNRWDWLLLACALSMMVAYTLYKVDALMHGPRYWYETLPLLMLLSSRGLTLAAARLTEWSEWLLSRLGWPARPMPGLGFALVAAPILALAVQGGGTWMFSDAEEWHAEFVPNRANALKGFNGIDDDLIRTLQDANLKDALVLVDDCGSWHCYGQAFELNDPWLDGDAVYARYLPSRPELLAELFGAYPERFVYQANFHQASLRPFELPGQEAQSPRRASEFRIDVPEPAPAGATPANGSESAALNDAQRLRHLEAIARLLAEYGESKGAYPLAPNPQTLCYYPSDAGCVLGEAGVVPKDPRPDRSYLYWSDGSSYIVLARLETAGASSCDAALPPGLVQQGPVACVFAENVVSD